jgi:hypothetical protein
LGGIFGPKRIKKEKTMQVLKLADDLFETLLAGTKWTTVRKGRRGVELGELRFEGAEDENLSAVVSVISVTYTALGNIPTTTLEADGFKDHDDALAQM